jgi:GLPGLI family protein
VLKQKIIFKYTLPIIVFSVLLASCDSKLFDKRISEGVIEYEITYPNMPEDNHMADFMPDLMITKFKKDQYTNQISAGMGMFQSSFVSSSKDYSLKSIVKLFNKKYTTEMGEDDLPLLYESYPSFTLTLLPDTKTVAGYSCKKALVIFTEVQYPSVYIYYTDQIHIHDPNWSLPYDTIDGVMLDYAMERYGLLMRFKAIEVREDDIDNSEFEAPEEYEKITPVEMKKQMDELFKSFF